MSRRLRKHEEEWVARVQKTRRTSPANPLIELALEPGLAFRSRYEEQCKEAAVREEDFAEFYLEGVMRALYETDCEAFWPFMDVAFETVDMRVADALESEKERRERKKRDKSAA